MSIWCTPPPPKDNQLTSALRFVSCCVCSCSEGSVHHTVAEVVRFVEERIKQEEGKESRSLRGPYLARLELLHRLRERGCPEESLLGTAGILNPSPFCPFPDFIRFKVPSWLLCSTQVNL